MFYFSISQILRPIKSQFLADSSYLLKSVPDYFLFRSQIVTSSFPEPTKLSFIQIKSAISPNPVYDKTENWRKNSFQIQTPFQGLFQLQA